MGTPALYLALRLETAWLEAQQGFAFKAQPMTMTAYRLDCEHALDLTDTATLAALRVDPAALACPWALLAAEGAEPPSWALARRLVAEGTALIRVPSYAPGATAADINLVLWDWSDTAPHQVTVVDDHARLPADARSWR